MSVSSWVESVQFVEVTISNGNTTNSGFLTKSQNYQNCVPFLTHDCNNDYYENHMIDAYFTGTTTSGVINFERYGSTADCNIKCYVVEFNSSQVRVQQGTFDIGSTTSGTETLGTTLSGVGRSFLNAHWRSSSSDRWGTNACVRCRIYSTSTLDFYRYGTSTDLDGHWYVAEDLGDNFRVTHINNGGPESTAANSVQILPNNRCIDPFRTFIMGSYAVDNATNDYPTRNFNSITLRGLGEVNCHRTEAATYATRIWAAQVFEFLDTSKVYTPFDFNTIFPYSNQGSPYNKEMGNQLPSSFNFNRPTSSIVYGTMQNFTRGSSTNDVYNNESFPSVELYGTTGVTLYKHTAVATNYPSLMSVVDWSGITVSSGTNSSPIPQGTGIGQSCVKSVENFRFTLEDNFGARLLTRGQNWENCAIFSTCRHASASSYIRDHQVLTFISEPGIVCFYNRVTDESKYVDVSVVEFWPDQVKVQQELIQDDDTGLTIDRTIDEVSDVNKCFLLSSVFTYFSTYIPTYSMYKAELTSTTNLRVSKGLAGYGNTIAVFIVEDLKNNFVVEHASGNITTGGIGTYEIETQFPRHNTFMAVTYSNSNANDYPGRNFANFNFSTVHRPVYARKGDTGAYGDLDWNACLVKFLDEKYHVFHINTAFTSPATDTGTYSAEFATHSGALTPINNVQQGWQRGDGSAEAANSAAIGNIRITDYDTRQYEISKVTTTYVQYASYAIIDWIGGHYQNDNSIADATPTRSLIQSVEKFDFNESSIYFDMPLTKGQDIDRCVPFVSNACDLPAFDTTSVFKGVYRYSNPDRFELMYNDHREVDIKSVANRQLTVNIVEFGEDITIQHGSGYSSTTTKSFDITPVNLETSFLVAYTYCDQYARHTQRSSACARFTSVSGIEFERADSTGNMFVTWYIVEAPNTEDYWKVQHLYDDTTGASADYYLETTDNVNLGSTMVLTSYALDETSDYPERQFFTFYFDKYNRIRFDRDVATGTMTAWAAEVIEFSNNFIKKGFKSIWQGTDFAADTTSETEVDLKNAWGSTFDLNRSMVIESNLNGISKSTTVAEQGLERAILYYSFKDNDTVYARRADGGSYDAYGNFFAVQFPEYNGYYMEGYTKETGIPVSRTVTAYRSDTNELIDSTVSDPSTGYFWIESTYSGSHYLVCKDDDGGVDYNHLVYGKIVPKVISGSFLHTISGTNASMSAAVPLGRQ